MAFDTTQKCEYNSGSMPKSDVKYIVFHRTEGHMAGDLATLKGGGGRRVSIHFLISPTGKVYQMLPMSVGANHAGFGDNGLAAKYGNANQHAYGIELSGMGSEPYTTLQLKALNTVVKYIDTYLGRKVPITTHAAIDPERKSDPRNFKWLSNYNKYRQYNVPASNRFNSLVKHPAYKEPSKSLPRTDSWFSAGSTYTWAGGLENGFRKMWVLTKSGERIQAWGEDKNFKRV